jgi:hypothetical protein
MESRWGWRRQGRDSNGSAVEVAAQKAKMSRRPHQWMHEKPLARLGSNQLRDGERVDIC